MWAIKHNPDILLLQETHCNKAKGKFVNLPGYRNFGNCLFQKYMTYLQKNNAEGKLARWAMKSLTTNILRNCTII